MTRHRRSATEPCRAASARPSSRPPRSEVWSNRSTHPTTPMSSTPIASLLLSTRSRQRSSCRPSSRRSRSSRARHSGHRASCMSKSRRSGARGARAVWTGLAVSLLAIVVGALSLVALTQNRSVAEAGATPGAVEPSVAQAEPSAVPVEPAPPVASVAVPNRVLAVIDGDAAVRTWRPSVARHHRRSR